MSDLSPAAEGTYTVVAPYEGLYEIIDWEGDRTGRIGRWMPGPMVSLDTNSILSPNKARAIAVALTRLADDLEPTQHGPRLYDLGTMDLDLLREQRRILIQLQSDTGHHEATIDALEGIINLCDQILAPVDASDALEV